MPVIAVPALAGVMAALLALLILWGIQNFVRALAGLIPKGLPIIGDSLHNLVLAGAAAAGAAVQWIMADVIRPVIHFVLGPVFAFLNWLHWLELWAATASRELAWIVSSAIPDAIARARTIAHELVNAARAYSLHLYHAALQKMWDAVHTVHAYAYHLYRVGLHAMYSAVHAVHAYAYHLYQLGLADMHAAVHAARVLAHELVDAAVSTLTAEIDKVRGLVKAELSLAESYADTAVATAVRAIEHDITVATAAVIQVVDVDAVAGITKEWDDIIGAVGTLEGVIGTDLPDIGAAVRAIPRAVPTDLAEALTIVGAISIPMLRYMSRCGVPNCRNLSQLGRELSNLLDDLAGGAFLALLIGLAADPIGTAHFLHDDIGPIAGDAIDGARSLLGV